MNLWFRFYSEVRQDSKVQTLPPAIFKSWVNILCLANDNDGQLPSIQKIAFELHLSEVKAASQIEALIERQLIDRRPDGSLEPHNWSERQYKNNPTERTRRFRERHSTGPPDPERNANETLVKRKRNDNETAMKRRRNGDETRQIAEGEPEGEKGNRPIVRSSVFPITYTGEAPDEICDRTDDRSESQKTLAEIFQKEFEAAEKNFPSLNEKLLQNANGSDDISAPSKKDFRQYWGPVECELRKSCPEEIFNARFRGIEIQDMTSRAVVLGVPPHVIAYYGNPEMTSIFLEDSIVKTGINLLRDRALMLIPLNENGNGN